jgi:hypothetical protein
VCGELQLLCAGCWSEQAAVACMLVWCAAAANLPLTGVLTGLGLGTGVGLGLPVAPSSGRSVVGIITSFLLSPGIGLLGPGLAAWFWNVKESDGGTGMVSVPWLVATDTLGLWRGAGLLLLATSASGAVTVVLLVGTVVFCSPGGGKTTASASRVLLVPLVGRGAGSSTWLTEGDAGRLLLLLDVAGSGSGDAAGKSGEGMSSGV